MTLLLIGMLFMVVSNAHEEIPELFQHLAKTLEMPPSAKWQDYRQSFISRWGRKPGQERWELPPVKFSEEKQQRVYEALDTLGLLSAWEPQEKFYDYAILPGAVLPTIKTRLDWLLGRWQKGIRFRQLVVLTGQRPLVDRIDRVSEVMPNLHPDQYPMHETEAARLLVHITPLPKGMEKVEKVFFDSPRIWQDNRWERPNTATTVAAWMKHNPQPGRVLLISSQPSAHYQDAVFKNLLPDTFSVETSAPALAFDTPLSVLLDAVAVWLRSSSIPPAIK